MNFHKNTAATNDNLELYPLKSALVNNHHSNNANSDAQCEGEDDKYYPPSSFHNPNANHPSSSSLFEYAMLSKRTPASKRLVFRNEEVCISPMGAAGPPPSRRREEQAAMANLRRKVAPALLVSRNYNYIEPEPDEDKDADHEELDNRPYLLRRVASAARAAPQWSEVRTAWQDSDFITECLCWHNVYRQRHGAPALVMAPELCDYAQSWANHLAHTNKFHYRPEKRVGQNLFQRPAPHADVTGQEVSSYWYAAVRQYDYFKEPDVLHANVNAGHFTQLVWAATRFFGVGKARSRAGKVIVVAHYSPPGNMSGGFELNVLPPHPDTLDNI